MARQDAVAGQGDRAGREHAERHVAADDVRVVLMIAAAGIVSRVKGPLLPVAGDGNPQTRQKLVLQLPPSAKGRRSFHRHRIFFRIVRRVSLTSGESGRSSAAFFAQVSASLNLPVL